MRTLLLPLALLATLLLVACDPPRAGNASIQGAITNANGTPATNATITLVRERETTAAATTTTNANGEYTLTGLAASAYDLVVTTNNQGAYQPGVTLTSDQARTIDLTLAPLGSITGTAILEARPEASEGVRITIPGTTINTSTAWNGAFTLNNIPAGNYRLTATDERNNYATTTIDVTVNSNQTTTLPATITLLRRKPEARYHAYIEGARVTLDASNSTDSDGTITTYHWNLGDGTTRTGKKITHTYTNTGFKEVTLTITDNDGLTDTASHSLTISTETHTATTDPNTPFSIYNINPGETRSIQINTPTTNGLLYLELAHDLMLEAHTPGAIYYSVDAERFSLTPLLPGPASLQPQAVSAAVACRGSCVLLPAADNDTVMLLVTNTGASAITPDLYAYTDAPSDENEPNDTFATATPLADADSGAIETIGDKDYYAVQTTGILHFDSPSALQLRANVHNASGERLASINPGTQVAVTAGEYVVIEALHGEASASAASLYYLEIR